MRHVLIRALRPGLLALAAVVFATMATAAPNAAMVMDARTGEVLHSRNADTRLQDEAPPRLADQDDDAVRRVRRHCARRDRP